MTSESFSITVDRGNLKDLSELGQRAVERAVELMATDVWGNVAREAPVDQGRLAGSFQLRSIGLLGWSIYSDVKYAAMVHEGTGIYGPAGNRITPRGASVLAFEWMGELMFRTSVAGQQANKYADRAVKRSDSRAQDFADRAVKEVFPA